MPPRVNRRSTRFTSQEPEQAPSQESPNSLVRPNLPALQGTPSTRRQYTYGSAAEPPPRVGAGLQRMDLSSAVNQAVSKRVDEDEEFVRPARPRSALTSTVNDDTPDNATRPRLGAAQLLSAVRDDDSSRSFGLESDYYEDATIGSAAPLRAGSSNLNPRSQRDTSVQRDSQPSRIRDQLNATTQPSSSRNTQQTALDTSRETRQKSRKEVEAEPERRTAPATRSRTTANTPAPNRTRQSQPQSRKPDIVENSEEEESFDDDTEDRPQAPSKGNQATTTQTVTPASMNPRFRIGSQEPSRGAAAKRRAPGNQGLFSQGNEFQSHSTAFEKQRQIPEDRQERDRQIQNDIQKAWDRYDREKTKRQAEIREAEGQRERERAARQSESQVLRWKLWFTQRVAWLSSLWPFNLIRWRREVGDFDDFDEDEYHHGGPTQWSRLLNPMTWLESLLWFIERIMDQFIELIDRLAGIQMRGSAMESILWTLTLVGVGLLLGPSLFFGFGTLRTFVPSFPDTGSMPSIGIHLPSPSDFVSGVRNTMPSLSWPSLKKDDDESDIWKNIDNIESTDEFKKAFDKLQSSVVVHNKALKRLESMLPKVIHMDLVDGRPVIKQEFWHALRDLLREDGSFLNMEKKNGNYEVTLEQQWKAIVQRLEKDPDFTMKLNDRVDGLIQEKLPSFWDTWFKNNNEVLEPLIEKATTKKQSAGSGAEFDQKLRNIVNEQLREQSQTAVTREEFLSHVQNELAKYRGEIQAEFTQHRTDMETSVQQQIQAARLMAPKGMSKAETETLLRDIILGAIADGSLKAVAKTEIHADWKSNLKYEVNFFAVGAGATIDSVLTTPTWDPRKRGITDYARGIKGIEPNPALAALEHWQDEGDCWCSANDIDNRGRPHGARLSIHMAHTVVPTKIAIEHIFHNATTDPGARPKHIEVFARFEDKKDRDDVLAETATANFFDDKTGEWDDFNPAPLSDEFVKISRFLYQGDKLNDGVHVETIRDIKVATDQIVVRALSNYGPANHTCFYRVRLFGNRVQIG
ncbi:hypothetical protein F53441_3963 [Fusarium austroafricanum]|uniref:SUN domain-containing protein n=1 Tax=Fusarium austroafricanum TaxID=2364996 RepID=A0A8H4KLG1_9HYPO|nr:hypothetical protein F53441_3963 [Fusarium austroafricanum]